MATEHAMAIMENDANKRIDAALAAIADRFTLVVPSMVPERLDPRMKGIRMIEHHADVLEAIAVAIGVTDLDEMTRRELNAHATAVGVEDAGDLPNKAAVIEAIASADDAPVDAPQPPQSDAKPEKKAKS